MSTMSVALTGNPNTGKSTIFNELTGMRQKIGNWPGVTVDKKMGVVNYKDRVITVVDLPGTYSINARSAEEQVVIDYFKTTMPDLAVDVIDSSNIERNLFLTVQLLEEGIPLLIDLNMQDEAERKGIRINIQQLEEALGMPVVQTVGRSKKSIQKLIEIFTTTVMSNYRPSAMVEEHKAKATELKKSGLSAEELDEKLIELRYDLIDKIMKKAVVVGNVGLSTSEKIDRVLANGVLALPILLGILYLVFCIAFTWIGQPLADAVGDWIGGPFTDWINDAMESAGVAEWLKSLIADGIVAGVGNVINFVPLIFTLFFMLSFLDGTGYMARVAFIMDPIMRRVGLTGKGIMPLIVGFGCGVPAIMGARALDSEKDRLTSILITPFLDLVFSRYIIGIVVAIIMAKVLGVTAFRSQGSTFLLELPPYRMPDMKTVLLETWDKGKGYLIKAGTIIFAMSVGIWFLSNYNADGATDEMSESFLASIGGGMSHLFALHGFETWESGAAVVTGIMAKESVVSTLGILYGVGDVSTEAEDAAETATQFAGSMGTAFTAASALAFMVFSQLYTPCMTSLGTIKKETGKWRWMLFAALYTFGVAWVVSLLVYWGACAFGMNG